VIMSTKDEYSGEDRAEDERDNRYNVNGHP
jgi:hypothetical protein